MILDPHEAGERLGAYRKDESMENFFQRLNRHLESFDYDGEASGEQYPVIYIVGLPRSGTTLLSQLLSRCFPVGYINNLIARFWLNPIVGIRLSQAVLGNDARSKISYESIHGVTAEPWGPHEFGYFWRHWLRLDDAPTHKLPQVMLDRIDRIGLSSILNRMAAVFEAPVVFKNIICGLQAEFLAQTRSNSLFVLIERDPGAVAASLLRSRKERYGDARVWWSLKPSTYPEISTLDLPERQIERQISDGARDFRQELNKPNVKSVFVNYEDLCAHPLKCLNLIADATNSLGYSMSLIEPPPRLRVSR